MEIETGTTTNCLAQHTQQGDDAIERLSDKPYAFELFAALRLLECAHPDKPRLGEAIHPRDEPVRVGQHVSLAFPVCDIKTIEPANAFHPIRLLQQVLGLFGQNGALPLHLTEYAFERGHHEKDETFAHFADIFHHRMLLLFYRAWANSQPVVSMDRIEHDKFGSYLAATCGLGMPSLRNRDDVDDLFKIAQAGILGRHVKCAEGLQIMLENYFSVRIQIQEWSGYWLTLPYSECSRLGENFVSLGLNTVLGDRVWDTQTKFRIVVGPLNWDDYQRFLPNGRAYGKLRDLVRLYVNEEFAWDVQLILKAAQIPVLQLGQPNYLGWSSWLPERSPNQHADDLVLNNTM